MRKLIYLLLLPLAVAVTACGGKKGSSDNQSLLARIDSIDAHGLQRMQTSKSETNFKFKGKDYHSFVSRTPDEIYIGRNCIRQDHSAGHCICRKCLLSADRFVYAAFYNDHC